VSRVFERSEQVKEKVFDVKLRIDEWRVLFAVNGAMDALELAAFLEMEEQEVDAILDRLMELEFVTVFDTNSKPEEVLTAEEMENQENTEIQEETAVEEFPEEEIPEEEAPEAEEEPAAEAGEEEKVELDEIIGESLEPEKDFAETPPSDEDDLDELIGNLLEEEPTELPQAEETADEVEVSDEPDVEKQEEEEFDLETIFEEEIAETEGAVSDVVESVEEPEETEIAEAPPAEPEKETAVQGTILVVDDSVVIRKMVEIALENENYNIVSVATGKDALIYLDETDPDLIILDIMLSDMNGLDVLKAIKASKQIPVVMLSAKDTPRETTKAKQLGADDFIPKPFKDEELVGKIKELIKN
jgi:CheY-like chemotaxis protein